MENLKVDEKEPILYCVQNDPDLPNWFFYINSSFLSNCTKQPYLQQSIHKGRKKQGHCV
jgi:hypothetical protein